ncbi:hypothetical protein FA13DRAFT_1713161 [Coprinellus micaceus]|uniref:Uncharacterized protein n=1 Tax=Coprinellus micaceus TaxID=71717 RepID=A0A4Y7SXJ8_COPMI|nr:hypothetical protein FA13DRAFT_1713161 [Coprinellus micaceus]
MSLHPIRMWRIIYRVNWIRTRSQVDRWTKEVTMLWSEMDWFVCFCRHRHVRAAGWAADGVTPGHSVYAYRQANMWYHLGCYTAREFEKKSGVAIVNCDMFLVGLGHIYHTGNIHLPIIIRKLVNLYSFGQLEDVMEIADIIAGDPDHEGGVLQEYEADWWSDLSTGEKMEPIIPALLYECWKKQKGCLKHRATTQTQDYLDLLPLSCMDLHSAFRTSEQLVQEASTELIKTLKHIRSINASIAFVEDLMHQLELAEGMDRKGKCQEPGNQHILNMFMAEVVWEASVALQGHQDSSGLWGASAEWRLMRTSGKLCALGNFSKTYPQPNCPTTSPSNLGGYLDALLRHRVPSSTSFSKCGRTSPSLLLLPEHIRPRCSLLKC